MAFRPRKPQKGGNIFKELYRSICEIIDYLPSLEIKGDNKNFKITESRFGRTIEQLNSPPRSISSTGSSSKETIQMLGIIVGYSTNNYYYVDLYENGYNNAPTYRGAPVQLLNVLFSTPAPVGTKVVVNLIQCPAIMNYSP